VKKPLYKYIFRAVSNEELEDIKLYGFRCSPDGSGYQTCKLFALTSGDAAKFGEELLLFEEKSFTVVKARITTKFFNDLKTLPADGTDIISIEINCLNLLKWMPLKKKS
jgi:hypothetical protein